MSSFSGEVFADSITKDTDQILHVVFTNPWTIVLGKLFDDSINVPHELFALGEHFESIHDSKLRKGWSSCHIGAVRSHHICKAYRRSCSTPHAWQLYHLAMMDSALQRLSNCSGTVEGLVLLCNGACGFVNCSYYRHRVSSNATDRVTLCQLTLVSRPE